MSPSTIRKAIGVVKDQTSISIAKVTGNIAPDLKVLIVKSTCHVIKPAEEKYIREILHLISQSRSYITACVHIISKRLTKTHDWVVALKSLMLVHRLLVDGNPTFGHEMMHASRNGYSILHMVDFRVDALSSYWDHSSFVKSYGLYLDRKLDFIAFERKIIPTKFSHKSKSYGDLVREMKPDRVLERLNKLLLLINRVLSCKPAGNAKNSKMVIAALYLVLTESFWIYADICEALGVLRDRFQEMEYGDCVATFEQYVNAAKTIDGLVDFYSWSKELGVVRASEFPQVKKVSDKILGTLERFLRDKKNMEEGYKENGPLTENLLDLDDVIMPPAVTFSGPKTVEAEWALALVDPTSNAMYDQGGVTPAVLALAAPGETTVQPVVNPQDPFAASLMVPPPPYVQLADMEKRKGFLVQEQQQVWQPYGMGKQVGYNYAHY